MGSKHDFIFHEWPLICVASDLRGYLLLLLPTHRCTVCCTEMYEGCHSPTLDWCWPPACVIVVLVYVRGATLLLWA
jgi:hypothetical protein